MDAAIEVEGLSKSYGEVVALEGVSLKVMRGELVSLLGPNGAGKTTLVKHLYCELRVPITLDKVDVYNKISDLAYENRLDECSRPASEEGSEGGEEGSEEGEEE